MYKVLELLFESHMVENVLVKDPSVFQLYASGRTTGMIVEIGEQRSGCFPLYEGHLMEHATVAGTVTTGLGLSEELRSCAFDEWFNLSNDFKMDVMRDMKEKVCALAGQQPLKSYYKMPDGYDVKLSSSNEAKLLPERLFFDPKAVESG